MLEEIKASVTVAKVLAVLAIAGAIFWFGHHVAANAGAAKLAKAQAEFAEYRRQEAAEAAAAYKAAQGDAQSNALAMAASEADRKIAADHIAATFNNIQKEAADNAAHHSSACALDTDGVRLWNRANAAIGD